MVHLHRPLSKPMPTRHMTSHPTESAPVQLDHGIDSTETVKGSTKMRCRAQKSYHEALLASNTGKLIHKEASGEQSAPESSHYSTENCRKPRLSSHRSSPN